MTGEELGMPSGRRLGAVDSETRSQLIEAAAQIVKTEGAAAVTARHLAAKVGLQRHIVHYYFGTIEDLLVAVLQRDSEHTRTWLAKALRSDDALRSIWEIGGHAAAITLEFSSLATRHEAIREEFKRFSEEFRRSLTLALEQHCRSRGFAPKLPMAAIVIALQSIAYTLAVESLLGIQQGHDSMPDPFVAYVDSFIGKDADGISQPSGAAPLEKQSIAGAVRMLTR